MMVYNFEENITPSFLQDLAIFFISKLISESPILCVVCFKYILYKENHHCPILPIIPVIIG